MTRAEENTMKKQRRIFLFIWMGIAALALLTIAEVFSPAPNLKDGCSIGGWLPDAWLHEWRQRIAFRRCQGN